LTFDLKALGLILVCIPFIWLWAIRFRDGKPLIRFSDVEHLRLYNSSLKAHWANLPKYFNYSALCLFLLAFTDPHISATQDPLEETSFSNAVEGISIYLILDQSRSMAEKVDAYTTQGTREILPKLDLLKQVSKEFVMHRPSDLIGIVSFARSSQVLVPLTLDHPSVLDALNQLDIMRIKDQDGTSIGYAIFKTANLIAATSQYAKEKTAYEIKNSIMILVTDGIQDPNPLDKDKEWRSMDIPTAAAYAKKEGIKLYIINIEPRMAEEEFAPHRHQMKKAAEETGGKFFLSSSTSLSEVYDEINSLEKSKLPPHLKKQAQNVRVFSFYPYLLGMGLACFLLAIGLSASFFKVIP
jgi:Ca-activated chloride channel family protein